MLLHSFSMVACGHIHPLVCRQQWKMNESFVLYATSCMHHTSGLAVKHARETSTGNMQLDFLWTWEADSALQLCSCIG